MNVLFLTLHILVSNTDILTIASHNERIIPYITCHILVSNTDILTIASHNEETDRAEFVY